MHYIWKDQHNIHHVAYSARDEDPLEDDLSLPSLPSLPATSKVDKDDEAAPRSPRRRRARDAKKIAQSRAATVIQASARRRVARQRTEKRAKATKMIQRAASKRKKKRTKPQGPRPVVPFERPPVPKPPPVVPKDWYGGTAWRGGGGCGWNMVAVDDAGYLPHGWDRHPIGAFHGHGYNHGWDRTTCAASGSDETRDETARRTGFMRVGNLAGAPVAGKVMQSVSSSPDLRPDAVAQRHGFMRVGVLGGRTLQTREKSTKDANTIKSRYLDYATSSRYLASLDYATSSRYLTAHTIEFEGVGHGESSRMLIARVGREEEEYGDTHRLHGRDPLLAHRKSRVGAMEERSFHTLPGLLGRSGSRWHLAQERTWRPDDTKPSRRRGDFFTVDQLSHR
jgi:hypothetical protein